MADVRTTVSRRQFLERATLSSAAFALAPALAQGTAGAATGLARPGYGGFQSLAPGEVSPEGWLRRYLQKQADQLASRLPEVSWPFTGNYWAGEETPPDNSDIAWWPWEQKGYWVDGALRCALTLSDPRLLQMALTPVHYTLEHAQADGYLGPAFTRDAELKHPTYGNFRWFHTVFFRALAAYGDATGDAQVAVAMQRHYLADQNRVRYGGPSRNVTNIEGMLWAYERTGEPRLLALAEQTWSEFQRGFLPGESGESDLGAERVYANAPIHAHGVTYIEQAKLPAILYLHTGKAEYLRFALAAQERIFSHHMLIDGVPSTTEGYRGTTPLDAHETCDISDHTWSWGYLLMATGDGQWADRIERAVLNAGFGAIRKDWTALQYFSSPNQVIATQNSSHIPFVEESVGWMAFRPNPGHTSACCGANVHRFFPNYVIRMWMTDRQGGLAAVLYGASTVSAEVGQHGERVEIHQETDYPFEEQIRFTLRSARPVAFPLLLRVPAWCPSPRLVLNDVPLELPPVRNGFVRIERTFHPGDRLLLSLPMHTALSYWHNDGPDAIGIEHGPLVYALPVREVWKPVITPRWSTQAFPEWDATPTSAWNYTLGVPESELLSQVRIERKPMTSDPWVSPPVVLSVPVKKLAGWELRADSKQPERLQTPPLPASSEALSESLEKVELQHVAFIPYGATHLRLTILPLLIDA